MAFAQYAFTEVPFAGSINQSPIADAGEDQSAFEGDPVSLDGSGSSDPDGTIASYQWTQTAGTAVVLTGDTTATPSFTMPNSDVTFELEVTDDGGLTDTATVTVFLQLPSSGGGGFNFGKRFGSVSLINKFGSN